MRWSSQDCALQWYSCISSSPKYLSREFRNWNWEASIASWTLFVLGKHHLILGYEKARSGKNHAVGGTYTLQHSFRSQSKQSIISTTDLPYTLQSRNLVLSQEGNTFLHEIRSEDQRRDLNLLHVPWKNLGCPCESRLLIHKSISPEWMVLHSRAWSDTRFP